jgi:phosphohistidine phosphatase
VKKLYLIRHAKSSWDDPDLADFERPLNKRGEKDAPRMGKRLKEKQLTPDIVITSPAKRALDTCLAIAQILGYPESKIKPVKSLYHASDDEIMRVLRKLKDRPKDKEENVLVFGHNPGLTEFANRLTNETIDNIPTAGVVAVQLSNQKWKDLNWGDSKLIFFDFPKNKE